MTTNTAGIALSLSLQKSSAEARFLLDSHTGLP
jgi:hypothetical protein